MNPIKCSDCRHLSHDVERLPVCELIFGQLVCQHCQTVAVFNSYSLVRRQLQCKTCKNLQPMPGLHDPREGYLAADLEPLPACPGFVAIDVKAPPKEKPPRPVPSVKRQTGSLF